MIPESSVVPHIQKRPQFPFTEAGGTDAVLPPTLQISQDTESYQECGGGISSKKKAGVEGTIVSLLISTCQSQSTPTARHLLQVTYQHPPSPPEKAQGLENVFHRNPSTQFPNDLETQQR